MTQRRPSWKSLSWILILVVALLVSACAVPVAPVAPSGDAATAAPAEAAASGDVTTLTWAFWGSPEEAESHRAVAAVFEELHPEIKIDYWIQPWSDYHTGIVTQWATNDPAVVPDIAWTAWPSPRYAVEGVLENLDPYIEASGYDLSDYWPGLLQFGQYQGSQYGLPRDIDVAVLYYNTDMFDAAGLEYPTDAWTWDDLAAAAEALTVRDAAGNVTTYGLAAEGGKYLKFPYQTGARLLDDFENPSMATIDTPEALQGFDFITGLLDSGAAMRPDLLNEAGGDAAAFISDQAAMIIQNSSRIGAFKEAGKNFDLAPVPTSPDGGRWNGAGGASWVISAASDSKDAAWTFLSWLQSAEGGQKIYTERGEIFPALQSVANSPSFLEQGDDGLNRQAFIVEASGADVGGLGYFPEWGELSDSIWTPALNSIWSGEAAAADVLPAASEQINTFLADKGFPQ